MKNKYRVLSFRRYFCVFMALLFCLSTLSPITLASDVTYNRSSEGLQEVLNLYGKSFSDITSSRFIQDDVKNEKNIIQPASAVSNSAQRGIRLTVEDNLIIDIVDDTVESVSCFVPVTDDEQVMFCSNDADSLLSSIEEIAELDARYSIRFSEAFDDDYWRITWEKEYNGIYNPYESVNAVINRRTLELVSYKRFDEVPETYIPSISVAEALEQVEDLLIDNNVDSSEVTCELTFTKQNYDQISNTVTGFNGEVRLAYLIKVFDGQVFLYVDATTGDIIGYDKTRDAAKCFSIDSSDEDFPRPVYQCSLAEQCLSEFGYTVLPRVVSGGNIRNDILAFLNRSDAYGFYVACHGYLSHGSETTREDIWFGHPVWDSAGNRASMENSVWYITPEDISGNWKFVFIDACDCAKDQTFANAFNIYSYSSNRAFLGWYMSVAGEYSIWFSELFFPEVMNQTHSSSIRDAAVWAANQIPGAGSTPIRFYGDTTYDGRLY